MKSNHRIAKAIEIIVIFTELTHETHDCKSLYHSSALLLEMDLVNELSNN